jgi:hypothetical protein
MMVGDKGRQLQQQGEMAAGCCLRPTVAMSEPRPLSQTPWLIGPFSTYFSTVYEYKLKAPLLLEPTFDLAPCSTGFYSLGEALVL